MAFESLKPRAVHKGLIGRHGNPYRHVRLELCSLAGGALSRGTASTGAAGLLRPALPDGGGEQYVLSLASENHFRPLVSAAAAGVLPVGKSPARSDPWRPSACP